MNRTTSRAGASVALMAALLFSSHLSLACGPFSLDAVFTFTVHPEYPLENFARGELGVMQPSYARSYLFVAYRYLNGAGFNSQEQQSLVNLWHERLDFAWPEYDDEWPKAWLAAREKVPGVGPAPKLSVDRHREKPNEYETYLNCQKDGFESAAATLEARLKQFGPDSPEIKGWVESQDQVFANCSEGQHIPASAAADALPLIRADRNYQIAAANFYAGNFDETQKLFTAISSDNASPWRAMAPYLVARTLIRKSSLGPKEGRDAALAGAEDQLHQILKDQNLASSHQAAARLLNLVRVRLHPLDKLHELAHSLLKQNQDKTLKQDLWDYTVLLDDFVGDDDSGVRKELPTSLVQDDLTDWLVTIQSASAGGLDHAIARFEAHHSQAWLVAALTKVDAHHAKAAELISAAARIGPDSPAFASVAFQTIRLDIESGKTNQARARLDDILAKSKSRLPASAVNLFLSQRMMLARDLKEFLTYAQRLPAGLSFNDDGREIPAEASEVSDDVKDIKGQKLFDIDGTEILNKKMPLAVLKQAALSEVLPVALRRDVAQAAWIRAVILDDYKTARELVPTLSRLIPEIRPLLDDYAKPQAPDAAKFSAVYAWLKLPGVEPAVDSSIGRRTPLNKQDVYRDNWWCASSFSTDSSGQADDETARKKAAPPITARADMNLSFLSDTEKETGAKEYGRLTAVGAAPDYLCRQVIAWANTHATDPRVPEGLHLAVKTTRFGCTGKESARWSKAAFDLLHRRYPNNPWTKQTRYWFKD
jgi:hypothetical protein